MVVINKLNDLIIGSISYSNKKKKKKKKNFLFIHLLRDREAFQAPLIIIKFSNPLLSAIFQTQN